MTFVQADVACWPLANLRLSERTIHTCGDDRPPKVIRAETDQSKFFRRVGWNTDRLESLHLGITRQSDNLAIDIVEPVRLFPLELRIDVQPLGIL